jgi:ABC-2 type transport system ATP-binding protein
MTRPAAPATPQSTGGDEQSGAVVEAVGLSKRYGDAVALADLDLAIHAGEIYTLLGPNGAGKTTTLSLLLGLLRPSGGHVRIQGLDVARHPIEVKRRVGYLPEQVLLYGHLSGVENLEYFAALGGQRRSRSALVQRLADVGLSPNVAHARASTYAQGIRQRVGLAIALVKDPAVLLLDEPWAALDPVAARELAAVLRARSAQGTAVLLTAHDLFRARAVATRIGILAGGRLVAENAARELSDADLERLYLEAVGPG